MPWVLWWITLFWLWMLLVGEWNRIELVAAAIAATLGATLAEGARAAAGLRFAIPPGRVPTIGTALLMVPVDFGILTWVLLRSIATRRVARGRFIAREFEAGGDDPHSIGNRAWTTLAANYSPNAILVDIDQEQKLVLFHDMVPLRKSEEPG
jgi:hypothetical protein